MHGQVIAKVYTCIHYLGHGHLLCIDENGMGKGWVFGSMAVLGTIYTSHCMEFGIEYIGHKS